MHEFVELLTKEASVQHQGQNAKKQKSKDLGLRRPHLLWQPLPLLLVVLRVGRLSRVVDVWVLGLGQVRHGSLELKCLCLMRENDNNERTVTLAGAVSSLAPCSCFWELGLLELVEGLPADIGTGGGGCS